MNSEQKFDIYRRMLTIRKVEEAVADKYSEQEMRCPVHLSIGQEAVPAALSSLLRNEDRVYSTHRCHAHYLAKGGSIPAMIAELYGKVTGCAKGKGGSMHLVDSAVGMMGASALVGGSIPMAVGSALAIQRSRKPHVAVAYFGDGGSEEGLFFESMNFAALKKLPMLFVCENNLYATYSHQRARQSTLDISMRAKAFGMAADRVDGYELGPVFNVCKKAVERARSGQGPSLLEFPTCRWRDHVGPSEDFQVGYRTKEEVQAWMDRCPLKKLSDELGSEFTEKKTAFEKQLDDEINDSFVKAKSAGFPKLNEMYDDIYA